MSSATIWESASFQWPLKSVTDAASTRVTVVEAQPVDTSRAATAHHPRKTVPMRGRPSLGATFILFLLQPFERLFGVLAHEIPRRLVEVLHLSDLVLELVEVQLGQRIDGLAGLVFLLPAVHDHHAGEVGRDEGLEGALEQAASRSAPVATTTVRITVLSLWNFIAAPPLYKDRERLAWGSPPLSRNLGPLLKGLDDGKRKKILQQPEPVVDVRCGRSVRYGNT